MPRHINLTLILSVALCAIACEAWAERVEGTAGGRPDDAHVSPAQTIASLSASFDSQTGALHEVVTFEAEQSAEAAAELSVGLKMSDRSTPSFGWLGSTDPAGSGFSYGGESEVPPSGSATFSADRLSITFDVQDPALVGRHADFASAQLHTSEGHVALSEAKVILGDRAPRPHLARGAKHLIVRGREVRLPLRPLSRRASQEVRLFRGSGGEHLAQAHLPASRFRTRRVTLHVYPGKVAKLTRKPQSATLQIITMLPDTSTSSRRFSVDIRRR